MITIYEKKTGKALTVEAVDAKEIMQHSPDLYTTDEPSKKGHKADKSLHSADMKDPRDMTVAELKAALDAKGVQYNATASKQELLDSAVAANIQASPEAASALATKAGTLKD